MTDKIDWPSWEEVAQGGDKDGAHFVAWPLPDFGRPQLSRHQRNSPRRLIRVVINPQQGSVNGYLCKHGVNYLVVYEDELPAIRRKVATDEQRASLKAAEATYERLLAAHMDRTKQTREKAIAEVGFTPWNILSRSENATSDENVSCRHFPGFPKILELDVCPDPVPPPETPESARHRAAEEQAQAMGRALATHLGGAERANKRGAAAG